MDEVEIRLLRIEGQIHALAQAWLQLSAVLEVQGLSDPAVMSQALLSKNWQGAPLEPHANGLMRYLVEELDDARESRRRRDRCLSSDIGE